MTSRWSFHFPIVPGLYHHRSYLYTKVLRHALNVTLYGMHAFFSCQCVCKLATLRCVDVSAFLFKDQNDFLHQTVDGSVRGCTEKNSCPSRLGLKVPEGAALLVP